MDLDLPVFSFTEVFGVFFFFGRGEGVPDTELTWQREEGWREERRGELRAFWRSKGERDRGRFEGQTRRYLGKGDRGSWNSPYLSPTKTKVLVFSG